jgi:glycosyltransferase involved in cell wall biosynthesis
MRILHLATFLQGGSGRVIVDLATEQHRAGHDVRVVTSATGVPGYRNCQGYLDELVTSGVPVRAIDSLFQRQHAANLAVVRALNDWYQAGREPDVIHGHAAVPAMIGLLFAGARRLNAATVLTMHGWGQVKSGDQVLTDVTVLNLMDRVVVPSRHSLETLVSLGVAPSRLAMVPYGVKGEGADLDDRDAELVVEMMRRRRQGTFVVACVGTVGTRKNQASLIEAVVSLSPTPVLCVFIGDGEVDGLRALAERLGAGDMVRVHGYSRAARRIVTAADLLVLPLRSEGQPVSALEAFCDGTLVAVSDIPDLVELVDDGTGFRFPAGDVAGLADTLRRVIGLSNSTRRAIRQRARAQYLGQFSIDAMTGEYRGIYESLVATRARGREISVA